MALDNAPLGKASDYPDRYDAALLFPVAREENRRRIGLEDGRWPWFGGDLWQAWEISWLRPSGIPDLAWAQPGDFPGLPEIDNEPVEDVVYDYAPESLSATGPVVTEQLCSHLLKSNCPVTGQPDWGTVLIRYTGSAIDRAGLLRYIVSFRQKQDFHEHCVETLFTDLLNRCKPQSLTVCARYTRRGGLDINPWRSTEPEEQVGPRLIRQ